MHTFLRLPPNWREAIDWSLTEDTVGEESFSVEPGGYPSADVESAARGHTVTDVNLIGVGLVFRTACPQPGTVGC